MTPEELNRRGRESVYNTLKQHIRYTEDFTKEQLYHDDTIEVEAESARIALMLTKMLDPGNKFNLVKHAERELEIIGEEPFMVEGYLNMIRLFSAMGHSGASASIFIPVLTKLLSFEALTPLTDDPGEWIHVGHGMWQNNRDSRCFAEDLTFHRYYNVDAKYDDEGNIIWHRTKLVAGK